MRPVVIRIYNGTEWVDYPSVMPLSSSAQETVERYGVYFGEGNVEVIEL